MLLGQHPLLAFPLWRSFAAACSLVIALAGCSNRTEDANENAAEAQQYLDSGQPRAARLAILEAISSRDDIVDYHLLHGRIELALGSEGAAYNAYSDALALDATNGEALQAVAQLGLVTGHLDESLEAAERISTLVPNQPDALLVRGIHALIRRRTDEAIGFSNKILENVPGHEGGTILKARALFIAGDTAQALEVLDALPDAAANSAGVSLTKLEVYRALRQPEPLSSEFVRLRRLREDDLALRVDEANFRFKRDERALAHQLVGGVLRNPKATPGLASAAIALWEEYSSNDVSPQILGEIIREGNIASRRALARYYIERGNEPGASLVISSLPSDPGLQARLALIKGQTAEANRLANIVLETDQTNCDALIASSEAALLRRHPAEAVRRAQQAASECPQQSPAWITTARAYDANGQSSGVSRAFIQGLDAKKQSTRLTAAYTDWLVSHRRSREAVALARRLTRYAPALISGWQLYYSLCRSVQPSCSDEAQSGLAEARTRYGIDPTPGEPAPNGLFGRFAER
jgi:tetratricopeptide (TPR) repeat protein